MSINGLSEIGGSPDEPSIETILSDTSLSIPVETTNGIDTPVQEAEKDAELLRLVDEAKRGWHGRTESRMKLSLGHRYDEVIAIIND